ncbi:MAG: cobalamin-dependent protein [Candidatus Hadarchaeum sp.]|uniref:cobalamin B12-binding domain-containing protein n=1 Tax=Candidatus Hadarchaeum sp. TaxID=2883567 RepID=UPI00316D4466
MSSDKSELEQKIREVVYRLDELEICNLAKQLMDQNVNPLDVINAFARVLREMGDKYERGELYLIELIAAGEGCRKAIMDIVEPKLRQLGVSRETLGKVILGTVEGDIHDIGKNIVAAMLSTAGFEIIDLGRDVPIGKFVEAVKKHRPQIVGLSALMTISMINQGEVIKALEKEGLLKEVKVVIGGAPTSKHWAEKIGANAYASDAIEAVSVCKELVTKT